MKPIIYITMGILDILQKDDRAEIFIRESLSKHYAGVVGDLDLRDGKEKEFYQANCDRLISTHKYKERKIWIITESDRSATLIILPEEYIKSTDKEVIIWN